MLGGGALIKTAIGQQGRAFSARFLPPITRQGWTTPCNFYLRGNARWQSTATATASTSDNDGGTAADNDDAPQSVPAADRLRNIAIIAHGNYFYFYFLLEFPKIRIYIDVDAD